MKRFAPKFIALMFALVCVFSFFACNANSEQPVTYTVTVLQSVGGTISYECADEKIVTGSKILVLLKADEHYEPDVFFVNGEKKIPDASGRFTVVVQNENIVLSAKFKEKSYSFVAAVEDSPEGSGSAFFGEKSDGKVPFSVIAAEHYEISYMSIDGNEIEFDKSSRMQKYDGSVSAYSNHNLEVKFSAIVYGVIVDEPLGAVTADKAGGIFGETVKISVKLPSDGKLLSLKVNGKDIAEQNKYEYEIIIKGDTIISAEVDCTKYTVQALGDEGIEDVVLSRGEVPAGGSVIVTAVPQKGYEATIAYVGKVKYFLKNNSFTLENISSDVVISVVSEKKQLTVSVVSGDGGTLSSSKQTFYYGDKITLYVTPQKGYRVAYLTVNGENIAVTDGKAILEDYAENIVATAEFEKEIYSVSFARSDGGFVSCDRTSYSVGEQPLFEFTCERGYKIKRITLNGKTISVSGDKFALPAGTVGDVTVYAEFEKIIYKISFAFSGEGQAACDKTTYSVGDEITVSYSCENGIEAEITVNGELVESEGGLLKLRGYAADLDVKVRFVVKKYSVEVNASAGGSYSLSPKGKIEHGGSVTLTLSPDTGYEIGSVTINGKDAKPDGNRLTIDNVCENVNVIVVFRKIEYSFIASSVTGGKIISDKQKFTVGEIITIKFVPDSGYKLDSAYLGGMAITDKIKDGTLTLTAGTGDVKISAVFVRVGAKTFNLSSSLDKKYGSVAFNPSVVSEGGTAVFVVNMNPGYEAAKVTANGIAVLPVNGVYYCENVKEDILVAVEYTLTKYAISVEQPENARIIAPTEYTVEDRVILSATPGKGYVVTFITINGKNYSVDENGNAIYSGYGDIVVKATITEGRYAVILNENMFVTASLDLSEGGISAPVKLTAKAKTDYKIVAVVINGRSYAWTGGTYEIKDIREKTTVSIVTDYVYYAVSIVNYLDGNKTTLAGFVSSDRSVYSVVDTVTFTVNVENGYYLRSVTINGVNYTDKIKDGKFTFEGRGAITVVANYAANGIEVRGTLSDDRTGDKISGVSVRIEKTDGTHVKTVTSSGGGRFSVELPNGKYVAYAVSDEYKYARRVAFGGQNQTVEISLAVAGSAFSSSTDFSKAQFSYDFDTGENVIIDGNTPSMIFDGDENGTFGITFTAHNQCDINDENRENEPGIGIVIGAGGNVFTCQFVRNTARIIINNNWGSIKSGTAKPYYNFNNPGEKHSLAFVKTGDTVLFLAKGESGEYEPVFVYSDARLNAKCTYSFYVTKLNSTKTLNMSFTGVKTYDSVARLSSVKTDLQTSETADGYTIAESYDDGYIIGKTYRVYAVPTGDKKLTSLLVDGNAVDFTSDGAGGGYVYITAGTDKKVEAKFTSFINGDPTWSDGRGYGDFDYDKTLFYRNDLITDGADPGVMFVSEEEDPEYGGWFYMTVTGDVGYWKVWEDGELYRSTAYRCYRSKNLSDWEMVGAVNGYALIIKPDEWAWDCDWAPEMIRDKKTGKYFLYFSSRSQIGNGENYSASDKTALSGSGKWDRLYLGIAMSDTPVGPYRLVSALDYNKANGVENKNTNANGEYIDGNVVPINFAKNVPAIKNRGYDFWPAIDVSPFMDEDGTLYLYFSQHMSSASYGNSIWVMKMKDMITPDYSTMRMVSLPGYTDVTSVGKGDDIYFNSGNINFDTKYGFKRYAYDGDRKGNGINEGVNVIKDYSSGKYFLTYSPFGYGSRRYSIMQAVSDSPLGPFHKLDAGVANPVLGIYNSGDAVDYNMKTDLSASIDYIAGTGHHCFVRAGSELFAVYHAFANPVNNYNESSFMGRRIAADRIFFTYNEKVGHNVLYGNGPTDTLQFAPESTSGYGNIAGNATVTATNAENDTIKYLSDGLFVMHNSYESREFSANGDSIITFSFDAPQKMRSVMIYSAARYSYALRKVSEIKLITSGNREIVMKDVTLNENYYNSAKKTMHYGGAIIAEFGATKVKTVVITVKSEDKLVPGGIKISDIVILGEKNAEIASDRAMYASGNGTSDLSDGIRVDGKPFDKAWQNAKTYTFTSGGINFEAKAVRGKTGAYFLFTAYDQTVVHSSNNGDTAKTSGLRRFYKNTGWQLSLYVGSGSYNSGKSVVIVSDAYNFIVDNGKNVNFASYINGTVNGYAESFSVEVFVPYENGLNLSDASIAAAVKYRHVEGASATVNEFINVCPTNGNVISFDC